MTAPGGHRHLRVHDEAGSALMLVPAAVLVLLVLVAIVLNSATVYLGQRELSRMAATAATDATAAVDQRAFYLTGAVSIEPSLAEAIAGRSLVGQSSEAVVLDGPPMVIVKGRQVCVELSGTVRPVFGRSLPGAGAGTTIHARSTATAGGDAGTAVPRRSIC